MEKVLVAVAYNQSINNIYRYLNKINVLNPHFI